MKNLFLLVSCIIVSYQTAMAWGRTGHQIIGTMAQSYLTDNAQAELKKLMGEETLRESSTWMDDVRGDERYEFMDTWHYKNSDDDNPENALAKIQEYTKILQDESSSAKDKVMAIRVLCHLVADVHQPLHCGYKKDAGGNAVKLRWKHQHEHKTNLHKAWDTDMIKRKEVNFTTYANTLQSGLKDEDKATWEKDDPTVWMKESQEALTQVYDYEGKHLDDNYYNKNIVFVDQRLTQASVRLAALFNSIFE